MIQEITFIQDTLYDYFRRILDDIEIECEIIFSNQNGVRPRTPFMAIDVGGVTSLGSPYYSGSDNNGIQKVYEQIERNITLHGFGNVQDIMESVRQATELFSYTIYLDKAKVVLKNVDSLVQNPNVIDEDTQMEYSFMCILAYTRIIEDNVGWIEHVEINDNFNIDNK